MSLFDQLKRGAADLAGKASDAAERAQLTLEIDALRRRMDPEGSGGAPLLGFNGAVMKAHGSAREGAIANAIRVATENIHRQVNQTIAREIARANERLAALEPVAANDLSP